jgi:hypothetical protein
MGYEWDMNVDDDLDGWFQMNSQPKWWLVLGWMGMWSMLRWRSESKFLVVDEDFIGDVNVYVQMDVGQNGRPREPQMLV